VATCRRHALAGLHLLVLMSLPAIVLGLLAIAKRKGTRRAVAGIVLGMLTAGVASATLFSYVNAYHEQMRHMEHMGQLHALAMATELYCYDSGGRFPPASRWNNAMRPNFVGGSWSALLNKPPYAMNRQLSSFARRNVKQPDRTVLFFDSAPGRNLNGGPELIARPTFHDWSVVVFVDGEVQFVTPRQARKLKWNP